MRWHKCIGVWVTVLLSGVICPADSGRIYKVLLHRLDAQGRHTLSPSLYERDAYQAYLRQHPDECAGLRFDLQWKVKSAIANPLKLRVEVRTSKTDATKPLVLETSVERKGRFRRWAGLRIDGERFKSMGEVIAWRATLWEGDTLLAEHKSFLW
jgi:hypothetical protein